MQRSSQMETVKPVSSEAESLPVPAVTLPIPSSACVSMNAMRPEQCVAAHRPSLVAGSYSQKFCCSIL